MALGTNSGSQLRESGCLEEEEEEDAEEEEDMTKMKG